MITRIDRNELVLFRFTEGEKGQLDWEDGTEFEFNDKMYDVVEAKVKGDTTFYWCWEDAEETELNQKLDELAAYALGQNQQNQENQKRLQSFFKSLYFSATAENEFPTTAVVIKQNRFPIDVYQSIVNSPPIPPPRFIS
jgi:hypothetical protein